MNKDNQREVVREFIFIHGYTGGISDFCELPRLLRATFSANISCPLLPGHGTRVEDLIGLSIEDLYAGVEREVQESVRKGKKVILVGLSMGAQVALYLASKYAVEGVVAIATTHQLRFPLNLSITQTVVSLRATWRKKFTPIEKRFRLGDADICYDEMPSDGWFIQRKLGALVNTNAKRITQPILFIHSKNERLGSPHAVAKLAQNITGQTTLRLLENTSHNMFYSPVRALALKHIVTFIRDEKLCEVRKVVEGNAEKVTVIIPAYNEARRVEAILETLSGVPLINEILVVDDGSTDGTSERVRAFHNVTLLINAENIGKGASMDRGVRRAKNNVIFFCDADLMGFTKEHAMGIIEPVLNRTCEMFVGVRGNFMQRAVQLWGLNSGERALRKEVWETLPAYYKYRYRIEVGLNRHVAARGEGGLAWKIFNYTQPLKESKYGFLRGTALRWWMNFDVCCAYFIYPYITHASQKREMLSHSRSH